MANNKKNGNLLKDCQPAPAKAGNADEGYGAYAQAKPVDLKDYDPGAKPYSSGDKEADKARVDQLAGEIDTLQDILLANRKKRLLVILQGTDASGKDGTLRGVQVAAAGGQQFHRLADAARLVDAALLADRQVHRQVQKRVAAHRTVAIVARHGGLGVAEVGVPLGVLGDPAGGQLLDGFHRLAGLLPGPGATKKASDLFL